MNNEICDAVSAFDMETLQKLVKTHQPLINQPDASDVTYPLSLAAMFNRLDMAELLLENGAYVHQTDKFGRPALAYAEVNQNADMIDLLKKYARKTPVRVDNTEANFRCALLKADFNALPETYQAISKNLHATRDAILVLLDKIQHAKSDTPQLEGWLNVTQFLYENSHDVYRELIRTISVKMDYSEHFQIGTGFLYTFIQNKNLSGFKVMLDHGFPPHSAQLICGGHKFNVLQLSLMTHDDPNTPSPFATELIKRGMTIPTPSYAWYANENRMWKKQANHAPLASVLQKKAKLYPRRTQHQVPLNILEFCAEVAGITDLSRFIKATDSKHLWSLKHASPKKARPAQTHSSLPSHRHGFFQKSGMHPETHKTQPACGTPPYKNKGRAVLKTATPSLSEKCSVTVR